MYQFFITDDKVQGERIVITGADVNHIGNVLRMKPGEQVRVSSRDSGKTYFCHITEITKEEVFLAIDSTDEIGTEFSHRVYLFQGLPKSDKMEFIIQKAVELGVYEIIPVAMSRCVVKLDAKKEAGKLARWNAISEAAAKQSKRNKIPEVMMPMSFAEALFDAKKLEAALIPYENAEGMEQARCMVDEAAKKRSLGIFIGPEGGFTEQEIEKSQQNGVKPISLGHRILRTETAGMMLMSVIMFATDQD